MNRPTNDGRALEPLLEGKGVHRIQDQRTHTRAERSLLELPVEME